MKDTDEQPDEELYRMGSEGVSSTGAAVPGSQGTPPDQHGDMLSNPDTL